MKVSRLKQLAHSVAAVGLGLAVALGGANPASAFPLNGVEDNVDRVWLDTVNPAAKENFAGGGAFWGDVPETAAAESVAGSFGVFGGVKISDYSYTNTVGLAAIGFGGGIYLYDGANTVDINDITAVHGFFSNQSTAGNAKQTIDILALLRGTWIGTIPSSLNVTTAASLYLQGPTGSGMDKFGIKVLDVFGAGSGKQNTAILTEGGDHRLMGDTIIGANTAPNGTLEVTGTVGYTPGTQSLANNTTSITVSKTVQRVKGSTAAIDIAATTQIAAGFDGQIVYLQGDSNTNTVTIDNGDGVALAGGNSFTLGNGDTLHLVYDDTDNLWYEIGRTQSSSGGTSAAGIGASILGLVVNVADANDNVVIDGGLKCASDDYSDIIETTLAITVNQSTEGANGLESNITWNTESWYYLWILKNPSTGVVKGLLSASDTDPDLSHTSLSGFTRKRLISAMRTEPSASPFFGKIRPYQQIGLTVYYQYNVLVLSVVSPSTTVPTNFSSVSLSAEVPSISKVALLSAHCKSVAGSAVFLVVHPGSLTASSGGKVVYINATASDDEFIHFAMDLDGQAYSYRTKTLWGTDHFLHMYVNGFELPIK